MQIYDKLTYMKDVCIGLGFFDGVHRGHIELIKRLVDTAKKFDSKSCIITFQKSPLEMFKKDVDYITDNKEKESLLSDYGLDYLVKLEFDARLKELTAEEYLQTIIHDYFQPKYIISGFNHTFGKNRLGNPEFLETEHLKYGYIYEQLPPVKYENEIVSSTLIKEYLRQGNVKKANKLLSHNFVLEGIVIKGNQLGRKIGFPTANIEYPKQKVKIPFGVYSVEVKYNNQLYKGMLNYGIKPTVNNGNNRPIAEVHIIDFDKDIYGETISIDVINKIRSEKKFDTMDELKIQIEKDLMLC